MSEIPALKQILEGAILAAGKPLSIDILIQLFDGEQPSRADVKDTLAEIEVDCEGRGFELKEVASGYRFQVRGEFGEWVDRLWEERPPKYTRAFLETLALIAYRQPITRGDIEEIRGVSVSTSIMRSLLEREWIRIVGHRDVPGRPAIYATTKSFLDYFDLSSLNELPTLSEIKDLDKMNNELDLGEADLIQPRSLDLENTDTETTVVGADDTTLQQVTDRVNKIQENIKKLFEEPEDGEDFDGDEDFDEDSGEASDEAHVEASDEAPVEASDEAHVEASDEAHVEARDEASVEAPDVAEVETTPGMIDEESIPDSDSVEMEAALNSNLNSEPIDEPEIADPQTSGFEIAATGVEKRSLVGTDDPADAPDSNGTAFGEAVLDVAVSEEKDQAPDSNV